MRADIHSLSFPQGFHLGAHGVGTESVRSTIPSDTLFSALLATWVRMGRDPTPWATAFPRTAEGRIDYSEPPFLLGSAFPYAAGLPFCPKPLGVLPSSVPEAKQKEWKRVQFVSESLFNRIRSRGAAAEVWPSSEDAERQQLLQGGVVLVTAEEADQIPRDVQGGAIWTEADVPRVTLDRVTLASNLFSVGRVRFSPRCGLWFAVVWLDPDRDCDGIPFREAFQHALSELGVSGLGGDRSVGYGGFIAETVDSGINWDDVGAGNPMVLLSRYHPRPDELPGAITEARAYQLEFLTGWGASPAGSFRRRRLWLLGEGSVIRRQSARAMGDLVDIAPVGDGYPGHPVWRYGLALGLPMEVRHAEES